MAMGLLDILKLKGLQLGHTPNLNFNPRADTYDPNNIENVKDALIADAQRRGLPTNAMDNSAAPQNAPMPVSAALPNSMGATAPQPPPVAPSGNGLMSWLNSDSGKGMLYGAGAGLIAKMQNKNDPVVPTALAAAEQYKQKAALQSLGQQLASANLTPQQKAFVQYAVQSGDPKLMNVAAKMMFPAAGAANKPFTMGVGQIRYDANNNPIIDRSHDQVTQPMANAAAMGLKPGTREYNDFIKAQTSGKSSGVFQKNELAFAQQVANDNQLEGPELEEAIDVLKSGGTHLANGKPLTFSQTAREKLDAINKARTTGQLITQGVQANQADAEMKVFDPYIKKGNTHYGNTIAGFSPDFEADSLKANSDDAAADRLSDYYTGQILSFDKAQLQIRIAMANPSVTTTDDLMKLSNNMIKQFAPIKSSKVKNLTVDKLGKALQEGLDVRNNYGIGASGAFNPKLSPNSGRPDLSNKPESPKPKMAESDIQYNMRTYHKTRDQVWKAAKEQGYS